MADYCQPTGTWTRSQVCLQAMHLLVLFPSSDGSFSTSSMVIHSFRCFHLFIAVENVALCHFVHHFMYFWSGVVLLHHKPAHIFRAIRVSFVRSKVPKKITVKVPVFWDVPPCSLVDRCKYFRGTCCLLLHCRISWGWRLNIHLKHWRLTTKYHVLSCRTCWLRGFDGLYW